MEQALIDQIWQRARSCCEYCRFDSRLLDQTFEIDHVLARKHGGPTTFENLALSCFFCNSYKGPNIAGIDPQSGRVTRLFNPRRDRWAAHFEWHGALLAGKTAVGRTTIEVLSMNNAVSVSIRQMLMKSGLFPPEF